MWLAWIGRRTRSLYVIMGIFVIGALVFCVWKTKKVFKYKKMKMRMTKRINAVITERVEPGRRLSGSDDYGPFYRYNYIFAGMDEYEGVIFHDRSYQVKKRYEVGETVSLLINEYNLEEFWFEEADEPGKEAVILWILWVVLVVFYLLLIKRMLEKWDRIPWF